MPLFHCNHGHPHATAQIARNCDMGPALLKAPTRVFVLTTGRTGSKSFARACGHIEGFTVGHESRARIHDETRVTYPEKHIEVDNRLGFFLGALAATYEDAVFVHLIRDTEKTAKSLADRWEGQVSIARAWRDSVLMGAGCSPLEAARQYVAATNANIREFLRERVHYTVSLDTIETDFGRFWDWGRFTGDREGAIKEWKKVDRS